MSESQLLDLWRDALTTCVAVAAPLVVAALTVGLTVAIIQAATQLQESVLAFAPKLVALGLLLSLGGPWLLHQLGQRASLNFHLLEEVARSRR